MAKVAVCMPLVNSVMCETEIVPQTVEEIEIQKLRERISDVIQSDEKFDDDFYLLQWLKARRMRADGAETMIRNSLKWRKENRIDELLEQDFSKELLDQFNVQMDGEDRDGVPVVTMNVGQWDVRSFVESHGRAAFVRFLCQVFVKCEQSMIDYNKRRNTCDGTKYRTPITTDSSRGLTMVMNALDYSMKQAKSIQTIFAVIECTKTFDAYFPQIVNTLFILNVDRFFTVILKMVKPLLFLPEIHVFDLDEKRWKPFLLERIPADQILPEFGGCRKPTVAMTSHS